MKELALSQAAMVGVDLNTRAAEDQVAVQQTSLGYFFSEDLKIKQNLTNKEKKKYFPGCEWSSPCKFAIKEIISK